MKDVLILDGLRTPFGNFGGLLKNFSAIDLGVIAVEKLLEKLSFPKESIDHVVFGNVIQSSKDAIYLARHIGLKSGVPIKTPALTVNRLCGSGFESVIEAARQIMIGESDVVLAGGTESMSQVPYCLRNARFGKMRLGGNPPLEDYLWQSLTDTYTDLPMALTAENIAEKDKVTRDEVDDFAYMSQMRAAKTAESGRLGDEIVEVYDSKRMKKPIKIDEHIRFDILRDDLSKLRPAFKKNGTVTAGNASGIVDGAAAVIVSSAEWAKANGYSPIGKIISWGISGVDPVFMGLGPVPSMKKAAKNAGMAISDFDLVEVNEAFASQFLGVVKELNLDLDKTNVNGGAVAIGHPLAATGTRLIITVLKELKRREKNKGIVSACIGGGQGTAIALEAM